MISIVQRLNRAHSWEIRVAAFSGGRSTKHYGMFKPSSAQGLMLSTEDSLGQIAFACGFSDQSHFTRVFRCGVGESPKAWRRLNLNQ
jgi:AraC family transcriptional regulator